VSAAPVTTPTLTSLRASRAQQDAVMRWLRPLVPFILAVVSWAAFTTDPRPALDGRGSAVSVALAGVVVGGLGGLVTSRRPRSGRPSVHVVFVVVLFSASAALVWLQPDGAGVAGIFIGVSFLAPLVRAHLSIPLAVIALVVLGSVVASGGPGSVATALLNASMLGAFYGMLLLANRLREANERAEQLVVELERGRVAQARAAGMAERQRLAREMHDVLAHSLSGLMLQLEGARMLAAADPADPRLPGTIERAHHLGRSGLEEARRAIGMLRDDDLPGPERLPALAQRFERDRGVPCRLVVAGEPRDLGSEARLALYRVAQEGLTNITKHARPERVEVRLSYEPSGTRLTVEDFGAPPPPVADGGYGLTGMRERAELLGGTLTAGPTSSGFRAELELPA
jgi:signal transduction histidine kinase